MHSSTKFTRTFIYVRFLVVFFLSLFFSTSSPRARGPSPIDTVFGSFIDTSPEAVWERVLGFEQYEYAADVVQTTIPVASVGNIGGQSKKLTYYVEGYTNIPAESMEMTLWSNGGSILQPDSGIQIKIEGETAQARRGSGPCWQWLAFGSWGLPSCFRQ